MDGELEVAAAASVGGFLRWRRRHSLPPGSACRNCGTLLRGSWCHACGQLGEDFHRSAHHLIFEAFEGFFHADGRLWRTLPRLVFDPADLTTSYLHGKRAPQIPPLRMFLIMLLIVFLVGGSFANHHGLAQLQTAGSADGIQRAKNNIGTGLQIDLGTEYDAQISAWFRKQLPLAMDHPQALMSAMATWANRFAFLTLPVSALLLAAIFAFRIDLYLFDHLIFSMHSLCFQGLLATVVMLSWSVTGGQSIYLLMASPLHLFAHMRGTYKTGGLGTAIRMFALSMASAVAFSLLLAGLVLVGLGELTG